MMSDVLRVVFEIVGMLAVSEKIIKRLIVRKVLDGRKFESR